MNTSARTMLVIALVGTIELAGGCAAKNFDFSTLQRPERCCALDAYDVFVGSWTWKAEMSYPESSDTSWTGTAQWDWMLDKRCLSGKIAAKSPHAEFEAEGIWSRHPKSGKYIWWMFNNWGYPQQGTAKYDCENRKWSMKYTSVGLDGTTSHGTYEITVVDDDTLDWRMIEWADALHTFKKLDLTGTYNRKK